MDRTIMQHIVANFGRFMFDTIMPLDQAVEGYDIFNKMQAQKVIFKP
jgi:hypothetical protein